MCSPDAPPDPTESAPELWQIVNHLSTAVASGLTQVYQGFFTPDTEAGVWPFLPQLDLHGAPEELRARGRERLQQLPDAQCAPSSPRARAALTALPPSPAREARSREARARAEAAAVGPREPADEQPAPADPAAFRCGEGEAAAVERRLRAEAAEAERRHAAEVEQLRSEMAAAAQRHAAEQAAAERGAAEHVLAACRTEHLRLLRQRDELTAERDQAAAAAAARAAELGRAREEHAAAAAEAAAAQTELRATRAELRGAKAELRGAKAEHAAAAEAAGAELRRLREESQRALAAERAERQREREAGAAQLAAARAELRAPVEEHQRDRADKEERQLVQQQEEVRLQLQPSVDAAAERAPPAAAGREPQRGPGSEPGELPQPAAATAAAAAAGAEAGAAEAPQGARAMWGVVYKWDDKAYFGFATGEHGANVLLKKKVILKERIPPGFSVRMLVQPAEPAEGKRCSHEALQVLEVHPPARQPAHSPRAGPHSAGWNPPLPYAIPPPDGTVLRLRVIRAPHPTPHPQTPPRDLPGSPRARGLFSPPSPLQLLETHPPPAGHPKPAAGPVTECEAAAEALRALLAAADEGGAAQGCPPPAPQQGQWPPAGAPQPLQTPDQAAEIQELLALLGHGGSGAAGAAEDAA